MKLEIYSRYQNGLTLGHLFPQIPGNCACGCGLPLSGQRKKWASDHCREQSFIYFSILRGNIRFIRDQLFKIDQGACRVCGHITDSWEADHIIPVHNGGGASTLDNFQTLCLDCHQEKSYKESQHRAISSQAIPMFLRQVQRVP